jgi:short-subunit dehydrogenase
MANELCAIVGCGETMGSHIAEAFANEGVDVALIARDQDHLRGYIDNAREIGVNAEGFVADATNRNAVSEAFEAIRGTFGAPNIVVYNVATMVKTRPSELTVAELEQTLPPMLYGAIHTVHEALPAMRERGSGTLLFTGGGFGIVPALMSASHSIGKAALRNWVQNLHNELREEGIHAATVTITRPVAAGTDYDPTTIAGHYVALHRQPPEKWEWERVHSEL